MGKTAKTKAKGDSHKGTPAKSKKGVAPLQDAAASFPIVGIGASAGGLQAFEAFFSGMPADKDPGMAFVLVQHLAPDHKSILTDLIRNYTRMQVSEVEDGMVVERNCAYIIPPNRDMAFLNGTLQLLPPSAPRGLRLPIDFFFRSLAQDQHERAICVVLAGTGSDGTQGVRAIKGEGGMAIVQNPESTDYDGMPRSAIGTGLVDFTLPPAEMPAQIMAYVAHAFGRLPRAVAAEGPRIESSLKKIFVVLRLQTGHDFSQYKLSTVQRRIERRMAVQQVDSIEEYLKYLQRTPLEVHALFRDLLIGVTSFFRDPDAFKAVERHAVQTLVAEKPPGSAIRVWAPGCSTGEEAYSLGILVEEALQSLKKSHEVQLFATDIDSQAIATARTGVYPAGIAADLTPQRLARHFTKEPGGGAYRIHKGIRDILVFSEQDVIRDPPFSKLDLISCRNLLIYMGAELQKKLLPLFHYALNPGGFLFLGTSETVGDHNDLFATVDSKWKLYRRKDEVRSTQRGGIARYVPPFEARPGVVSPTGKMRARPEKMPIRELAERALLEYAAPVGGLVDEQGNVLYLHGRTGRYLEPEPGEAGVANILKMAREGLRHELTTALHKAVSQKEVVHAPGLRVKTNGDFAIVNLTVRPILASPARTTDPALYLVVFAEAHSFDSEHAGTPVFRHEVGDGGSEIDFEERIAALKQELNAKEEYLETTNEELKTSNEELRSSNEEMQSVNEELQSTNEELETSKEELQSVNEELATVNAELQNKVVDLSRANNDMNNLLAGTGIGTIFVDKELHILRFTPAATEIINLIQSDVGRPVGHIVSNLVGYDRLAADAQTVLDTLTPQELEVQTTDGRWYKLRMLPYRTLSNVIEGVVVTFADISEMKRVRETLWLEKERMRVALHAVPVVLFNQDRELRYTWMWNPAAHFSVAEVIGKSDTDLLPAKEAAELTRIKRQVLDSGTGARRRVQTVFDGKPSFYDLTVEPLRDAGGEIVGITCVRLDSPAHEREPTEEVDGK